MTGEMLDEKSIFNAARAIESPKARAEYLRHACGGDAEWIERIETLLRGYEEQASFLESPPVAIDVERTALVAEPIAERLGTVIGPYKLLQQIGEGGMGVVFMAEQTRPVQRTVALKIIKPGMDTRQVIARFEAERQALAMMDHPNIARVIDAGTTDPGRPFFVMDLVKGVPIIEYCDQEHLTIRERLELFTQVCHAVQHAHQKGIIHRDLKPSNVLVAEYDGKPVPKVIDFGVAKATEKRLTERTMFTEYGQIIGTFAYMSPEQARFNQLDVDTRSDIYSLGVLLYELVTGSTPFEKGRLETTPFEETLRIIRDEEPPKPSTRLGSSQSLPSIAANRHTEPARLTKEIRGELDWIVVNCLEKDRNRRYESAGALASDITHYLNDEPVSAAAPSRLYRASKFVRRNKGAVIATAAVLAGLIAGIIGMTIGLVSQSRARAIAERERAEAQLNLATALRSQGSFADAEKLYRQALATGSGDTLEERQRAARTLLLLAQTVSEEGESDRLYREAMVAHRAAFPPGSPATAQALLTFGQFVKAQGRLAEAESVFREAYETRLNATPPDHIATGQCAVYYGHTLYLLDRYAEAEPLFRKAIAEYQLAVPVYESAIAHARIELGRDLSALGRQADAESEFLKAARGLESRGDFRYAATALGAFYAAWDQKQPGKGYDAKAKEWFLKSVKDYIRPAPDADQPKEEPPTKQN